MKLKLQDLRLTDIIVVAVRHYDKSIIDLCLEILINVTENGTIFSEKEHYD